MAGTIVADTIQADSTSTLVLKNGVANTPPTIQDSAGTQIGTFCRAWAKVVSSSGSISASFNVSSVTLNSTGKYTVTLTNALPDTNYSVVLGTVEAGTGNNQIINVRSDVTITTTVFGIATYSGATPQNVTSLLFAVFR